MIVENFDGDGFADQLSIIYSFETDNSGDVEIRELVRSGFGEPGSPPGDVTGRDSMKSDLTDLPPELIGQSGSVPNDCRGNCPVSSGFSSDDPAKARTNPSDGSNYLNTRYIVRRKHSRSSKTNGGRNRTTTTSTLTWLVGARCGSRTCCFFGNRNKRLASGSGYADCRVPLAGRS